jgi:hypothetical protein
LFRNRLLLAALVILVAVSVLLTLASVRAGDRGGGGAGDIIRVLL